MIEVDAWLFWGLCAMAAVGVLQAVLTLMQREPQRHWAADAHNPPGAAPPGFRWVLVRESDMENPQV